jgi:NitT/TauT family transport system substrate-binding protein
VKKNGFGAVDMARLDASIEQIALTYQFKGERPKGPSVFDPSFLPAAADRASD